MKNGAVIATGLFTVGLGWVSVAAGQTSPPKSWRAACAAEQVETRATRPNFSSATDTTLCGVVEADYGWARQWPGAGIHQNFLSSALRFGIAPRMDFRWGSDNHISQRAGGVTLQGSGDNWLGVRYRFFDQKKNFPALGFSYTIKVPTANPAKGAGSGLVDHALALLVSKDFGKYHCDFNAVGSLTGDQGGLAKSTVLALAVFHPVVRRLTALAEVRGGSQPNGSRFASGLGGLSYAVNRRFVLDTSFEPGLTSNTLRSRLQVGVTYALGNLYSGLVAK